MTKMHFIVFLLSTLFVCGAYSATLADTSQPNRSTDTSLKEDTSKAVRDGYLIWRNFARQPHLYSSPFLQQLHNYRTPGLRAGPLHSEQMFKPAIRSDLLSNSRFPITRNTPSLSSQPLEEEEDDDENNAFSFDDFDDVFMSSKRDTDYGHMRFGRTPSISRSPGKRPQEKKVESDYGHFRFG